MTRTRDEPNGRLNNRLSDTRLSDTMEQMTLSLQAMDGKGPGHQDLAG